ncbi:MAG: hypothetical protein HY869_01830 [Chloroflexi bacterium]|nr:hypothetical protein [Chloroflexota bacterium]
MKINLRSYRIGLAGLALLAFLFTLITTFKYGAGVSSDAVRAMATAESLQAGRGFVDNIGAPYVHWPPLYPLLLAALSLLTRLDIFHVGWTLNLVLFPLNVWLWGLLFERIFPDKLTYALFASAVGVLSTSVLRVYANVASDPFFVTLMILVFLLTADYLETPSPRSLWWMFGLAGLSTLQRYLGVVLFGVGGLVVLARLGWRGLPKLVLPVALTFVPTAAWLILHNYLQYDTLFGPRVYGQMWPGENISLSLTKILHWFMPYLPGLKSLMLQPWTLLLPLVALVALLNLKRQEGWSAWGRALTGRYVWPGLVFAAVYYFLLAYTVNTIDHRDLTSDRYYIILLPLLMVFLLLTYEHLVAPHLSWKWMRVGILIAALAWFVYPIHDMQEYLRLALVNGEPSNYNIYNSTHFMDMAVTRKGRQLAAADPGATFYTNYVNLLWFQYQRPIHPLPAVNNDLPQEQRLALLRETYPGWPGAETGYILWYMPNEYKYLAPIEDLKELAHLELIYEDDDGQIYRVGPR